MSTPSDPNDILAFFSNADASDAVLRRGAQINAPLVKGAPMTVDEMSGGGLARIVILVIDASPSMGGVRTLVLDGFGQSFIPALKGASEDDVAALRIAGLVFSNDVKAIWTPAGSGAPLLFHTLDELPPLTPAEYDPSRGNSTALHQAIIDAITYGTAHAAQHLALTGTEPEVEILVLSDGANNLHPMDPAVVRTLLQGLKKHLVRCTWLYFETDWGISDFHGLAAQMGFDPENVQAFTKKPGETDAELRSRFRRLMQVASKVSATRTMSAVNATAATAMADAL